VTGADPLSGSANPPLDSPEIAERLAAGDVRGAADLAARAGNHARAAALLEEACDFVGAARQALEGGDASAAARLAALGSDASLWRAVLEKLSADATLATRVGADLAARGFSKNAGELLAAVGALVEAARAFADAGDAVRSAECFERAGRPADAARELESALRARPEDDAARLALGQLLARHGRTEAAVRTLQRVSPGSPEHARALPLLARSLEAVGLGEAARDVRATMARLGVADEAPAETAGAEPAEPRGHVMYGRYEVTREVSVTPNARVLEAVDRITSERVAVKLVSASAEGVGRDALLRFEREARALGQLRHPNVVPLRAYVPEGPAIVLAWMSGGSLADLMRREPIAPARAKEIVVAVLDALGEAHRLGILHRDVKPSNVLFDEIGTPRLSDFGAAHLGDLSRTATAGAIGTFAYMAPEQRLGRPATVASDVFAAGALLYELLTGRPAEPARSGRISSPPSEHHPDLSTVHDAIVARLLEEEPARRPDDAFEARRAVSAASWPSTMAERAPSAAPKARTTDRPPPAEASGRLSPPLSAGDGRDAASLHHDAWIEREIMVLSLDDATLARARAFALAGHPVLPVVLRADSEAAQIWVAPPPGRCLADDPRALSPGQIARVREALEALHAVGGAHGAIDAEHLYLFDGDVSLAWPRRPSGDDDAARDAQALTDLTGV
jgi:serine/threonine-protein kinase